MPGQSARWHDRRGVAKPCCSAPCLDARPQQELRPHQIAFRSLRPTAVITAWFITTTLLHSVATCPLLLSPNGTQLNQAACVRIKDYEGTSSVLWLWNMTLRSCEFGELDSKRDQICTVQGEDALGTNEPAVVSEWHREKATAWQVYRQRWIIIEGWCDVALHG